jgi:hypothetical protein
MARGGNTMTVSQNRPSIRPPLIIDSPNSTGAEFNFDYVIPNQSLSQLSIH